MLAENEIIDLLTEYATNERLFRIIEEDKKFRTAAIHVEDKYAGLESSLTEEQRILLDLFLTADSKRAARMEFLIYQQGLKDMFNLIMSLQEKQGKGT